jgi:ectoine hydroxylase-related dioxygenase (phytanoyl-CoA dioxygenase family)
MQNFDLQRHGVEIRKNLVTHELILAVIAEVDAADISMPKHGIRNAEKKFASVLRLIRCKLLLQEARRILGKEPQVVRVIFFDKTPDKNWLVAWHQDRTVALNGKFDLDGWGPWTLKEGTQHVQPPLNVMNEMITFRLHLDPAGMDNGCLKVIPGSHKYGILKQKEIDEVLNKAEPMLCVVEAGDAVIMRPLILHSSSKASAPGHRRVIHVEFSGYELPDNINWA